MTLSVIIPVFNSGQYIKKCLHSLLNQTFQDFEIIVVDDGSDDDSRQIVESLLSDKENCLILSQKNGGASAARNAGISYAKGEWITFVDSDDFLTPDYLERLVNASESCDLLVSGIVFMNKNREINRVCPPELECTLSDIKHDSCFLLDYAISSVGKLYRKSIIDNHKLRFDETMTTAEDRDFNIDFLSRINKIRSIPYAGYFYQTSNESSLTKSHSRDRLRKSILFWNKMYRLMDGTNEAYLAHRLFFFIVDSVSGDLQRKDFSGAIHSLIEARPLLDRSFLRHNLKKVQAPGWQKALIRLYIG